MMATSPSVSAALSTGRALHQRPGAGSTADVVQRARLLCRRLSSGGPGLVLVCEGRKILRHRGQEIAADAGQVVLIPDRLDFDVINEPRGQEPYRAMALNFAPELIRNILAENSKIVAGIQVIRDPPSGFFQACESAAQAISAGSALPDAVAAARVGEVLLWLASLGLCFERHTPPDPVDRIRKLLMNAPGHDWSAGALAKQLGTSQATMRRRLAAAGTSFTDVLIDIRMTAALYMLQSTDLPITTIALDVGYDSASRFAARFRARFEFSPSEIRGHRREIERIGTKSDRDGAAFATAQ